MCKPLMLIVEVDGSIHEVPDVMINEKKRQQALEEAGFMVLRFTNEEVLTKIQWVQNYLEEWIENLQLARLGSNPSGNEQKTDCFMLSTFR